MKPSRSPTVSPNVPPKSGNAAGTKASPAGQAASEEGAKKVRIVASRYMSSVTSKQPAVKEEKPRTPVITVSGPSEPPRSRPPLSTASATRTFSSSTARPIPTTKPISSLSTAVPERDRPTGRISNENNNRLAVRPASSNVRVDMAKVEARKEELLSSIRAKTSGSTSVVGKTSQIPSRATGDTSRRPTEPPATETKTKEEETAKLPPATEEQAYFAYIRLLQWRYLRLSAAKAFDEQCANVKKQLLVATEILREETQKLQEAKLRLEENERLVNELTLLRRQIAALEQFVPHFQNLQQPYEQIASAAHSKRSQMPASGVIVRDMKKLASTLSDCDELLRALVGDPDRQGEEREAGLQRLMEMSAAMTEMQQLAAESIKNLEMVPETIRQIRNNASEGF